jgi:phage/plasmid-like protein (TIGR03299 family)
MAHELSTRANGSAEMAFVGETPWHGLGQPVTKGASIGVWAKEAGLDWQAQEATLRFTLPKEVTGLNSPLTAEAGGYKMLYRSDTSGQLAIVGDKYEVVQPRDVLEFFRDLTEVGGWWIHTAGVLREGRKIWAMATNGDQANVGKGDVIKRNLLLATSLDGSMKTVAMETTVRVVCNNTLSMALSSGGSHVSTSHRSMFNPDLVKRALGVNQNSFALFMAKAKEMAETPVQLAEARDLLRVLFKVEAKPKVDTSWLGTLAQLGEPPADQKENRSVMRVLELFSGDGKGSYLKTAHDTKWGLLNAITEHVDHEMGRSQDTRLDAAWFGRGALLKRDAVELLTTV